MKSKYWNMAPNVLWLHGLSALTCAHTRDLLANQIVDTHEPLDKKVDQLVSSMVKGLMSLALVSVRLPRLPCSHDIQKMQKTQNGLVSYRQTHQQGTICTTIQSTDLNYWSPSDGTIESVRFHPLVRVALTASSDRSLRIFEVDGRENQLIKITRFEELRIRYAEFTADGSEIILTGSKRFFYVYNVGTANVTRISKLRGVEDVDTSVPMDICATDPDNRYIVFLAGRNVILADRYSKFVSKMFVTGYEAYCCSFNTDGSRLFTAGSSGEVSVWNMTTLTLMHTFWDYGAIITSQVVANNDIIVLTSENIAKIYNMNEVMESISPNPITVVDVEHLKCTLDSMDLLRDGRLLAISCREEKHGLRLVNVATGKVLADWPIKRGTVKTALLGHVTSLAFSPKGNFLAIGNTFGRVMLYRIEWQDPGEVEEKESARLLHTCDGDRRNLIRLRGPYDESSHATAAKRRSLTLR